MCVTGLVQTVVEATLTVDFIPHTLCFDIENFNLLGLLRLSLQTLHTTGLFEQIISSDQACVGSTPTIVGRGKLDLIGQLDPLMWGQHQPVCFLLSAGLSCYTCLCVFASCLSVSWTLFMFWTLKLASVHFGFVCLC